MWTMVAAFLVFGMQVGFTMLEAGFCRSRETVNVLIECVFDTCLCGILFYAIGFAFMFGHGNGFIGWGNGDAANPQSWLFLQNVPLTYESTGVAFLAFWVFQFAFADTCSTITSGAMIGRTGFWGDILYSAGVSGLIYPIIGHWAWGPDGFLASMGSADKFLPSLGTGFHDFAGSTVVHTIGGFIALAGAIVLGPRLGRKFKRGRRRPDAPARPDDRRQRRAAALVRVVRVQPRQHAVGDGRRRVRPGGGQHHARRLCRGVDVRLLHLRPHPEVGRRGDHQRVPWPASSPSPARATGSARSGRSCSAGWPA